MRVYEASYTYVLKFMWTCAGAFCLPRMYVSLFRARIFFVGQLLEAVTQHVHFWHSSARHKSTWALTFWMIHYKIMSNFRWNICSMNLHSKKRIQRIFIRWRGTSGNDSSNSTCSAKSLPSSHSLYINRKRTKNVLPECGFPFMNNRVPCWDSHNRKHTCLFPDLIRNIW